MTDDQLTPREREILDLKCRGYTAEEISHLLGIAEQTVRFHASSIILKTKARSLLHAASVLNGWDRTLR